MRSIMPFTIRYSETDMMGVVHHANYALYFEDARTRFLDDLGYPYAQIEDEGYMSPVVSLSLSYGKPLRYGKDKPLVVTTLIAVSHMKATFHYEVFESEEAFAGKAKPNCTGESQHCLVDATSFKPVNMRKATPKLFELYQKALEQL